MDIEKAIRLKTKDEKAKITKWLLEKNILLDNITKEEMVNAISSSKSILNENIIYCTNLEEKPKHNNTYISMLEAKTVKIDKLIKEFNSSNTTNKKMFVDNIVEFDKLTMLKIVKLEIDEFNFELPITFTLRLYAKDGEVFDFFIIPYNYSGLYNEYFDLNKKVTSRFKVAAKDNVYFYNCIFNTDGLQIGTEKRYTVNKDFYFDKEGFLIIDRDSITDKNILVKYQPGENAFEIPVNKMIYKAELICDDNGTGYSEKFKKKLVIANE